MQDEKSNTNITEGAVNHTDVWRETVEDRIKELQHNVDGLRSKPWYRQIPVMISIIALALNIATTLSNAWIGHEQRILGARVELRGLIQRLSTLPIEMVELLKKYENDPQTQVQIYNQINEEYQLVSSQAADVIARLPEEEVSTNEYCSVSYALLSAGVIGKGEKLADRAIQSARDSRDRLFSFRLAGIYRIAHGEFAVGRDNFKKALKVFDSPGSEILNVSSKAFINADTERMWAEAELAQRQCADAKKHIQQATSYVSKATFGQQKETLRGHLMKLQAQADSCAQATP